MGEILFCIAYGTAIAVGGLLVLYWIPRELGLKGQQSEAGGRRR